MSNAERQRQFRKRNPGYYQRLHAKRRAAVKARSRQRAREMAIARIIAPPMQLCLPAPQEVTLSWADELIRDIQQAAAQRAESVPVAPKIEQAASREAV